MSQVAPFPKEVKSWLKQAEDFRFEVRGTKVIAFPNVHLSEYDLFRQELKVVHAGRNTVFRFYTGKSICLFR